MRTKVFKLGLAAVLILLATAARVRAEAFTYTVNNDTITITGYAGPGGDVVIPDTLDGMPVTAIGDSAFAWCAGVTNLFIPASVTSIGYQAFVYCAGLAALEVAGENPVYSSLDGVLFDAARRTLLRYPEGRAGSYAVPEGVEEIADQAFYYCLNNLAGVALPASVVSIGDEAFSMCFALAEAQLSTNVASIGQSAFFMCNSLLDITLPNSVTNLGDYAFQNCASLTNAVLPAGLSGIGSQLFHSCGSLEQIVIPQSVASIGRGAFSGCGRLKEIELPAGLTAIGDSAFYACSAVTNMAIPDGVASIGASAFGSCGSLSAVAIPGSVSSIGDAAFSQCFNLADVTIADGVTSIGTSAFSSCGSLATLTLPGSLSSIGDGAFYLCTGLEALVVSGDNPVFSSHGGVLFDKAQSQLILCPEGKAGGYAIPSGVEVIRDLAFANCTLLAEVDIPDSVTTLGTGAFGGCGSLTNAVIGSGIAHIGNQAFSACGSLADIMLPDTVSSIGDAAFSHCTAFTHVALGSGVSQIGSRAFAGCTGLVEMAIPESVVQIGDEAFFGCTGLTSLAIPAGVTHIGYGLFSGCSSLSSIALPAQLKTIGAWAFSGCSGVASLVLPASLEALGDYAFAYCTALQDLYFLGNAPGVGYEPLYFAAETTTIHYQEGTTGWETAFDDLPKTVWIPEYLLAVAQGSGSGTYTNGAVVAISADAAPSRQMFDRWIGATQQVANVFAAATTVTMPAQDIAVAAAYRDDPAADFTYVTNSGAITISGYTGAGGNVAVPAAINGFPVTAIGDSAFYNNLGLIGITLPDSVASIGTSAFSRCYYLTTCDLGSGIVSIGNQAFYNCIFLPSIHLSKSVASIGYGAFMRCSGMAAFTVDDENSAYSSHGGVLLDKGQTAIILCPGGKGGVYAAPDSVTSIEDYAFQYAEVSEVVLSTNVASIGSAAFSNSDIANIVLPPQITGVSDNTFRNCVNLTNVVFEGNVTAIGNSAFYYCRSLPVLSLPACLAGIGNQAFGNCTALTALYFSGSAPSLGSGVFDQTDNATVYRLAGASDWPPVPDLWGNRPTALWSPAYQPAMRQDGYEAPAIDPYWAVSLQNGTIAPSTAQAHGGAQSLQFSAPGGGQKYLHLRHVFDQPQWGTVTVWVYDSLEYIYFNVNLEDSLSGTTPVSIGVQDWDTSAYYFYHSMTNWAGGKSTVPRAGGWRKFTLRNVESELVLSVDGQELYRGPSERPFDTIRLTVSGPGDGTIYFDDFTFIPDAAGDGDADSLPDAWEARYFGDAAAGPQSACANNISTLLEAYTAGLDPTDPQSRFSVGMAGKNILEWSGVPGRVYSVYWSTNLLNRFECLASNLSWNAASFTDTVHQAEQKCFYRLKVRLE